MAAGRFDEEQIRPILPNLIDSLGDAVVVVDRAHRVVAANRCYLESFGTGRADVVGMLCSEVLNCPEASPAGEPFRCPVCETSDLKEVSRRIRTLPDATGTQRRWEATFNPVLDARGEVTHVVEVWRDITVRSQLEAQLGHSERLAALGTLAAGVAHEINNPLSTVMTGVGSLERWIARREFDPGAVAEAADVLRVLEREITRCRETTDKLMLLAQPYSVEPTWVDLNQAVRDTLSLLRYQMRKQQIEASEDLDAALPNIWAKDSAVRGVCMNLMLNAVQAMPEGGRLTVRTGRGGAGVVLHVADTGTGVAPEHLDRIWDAFFTTKPVGQGTGLGLSITQRVVTRHGGTIRVESRAGEGARFIVELPIEGPGGHGV
jgi:two-component system NtrC family sensor kinase